MLKTDDSPTPDARICVDRMKLTVTNHYPAFRKRSEQEIRQEAAARLYRIFRSDA